MHLKNFPYNSYYPRNNTIHIYKYTFNVLSFHNLDEIIDQIYQQKHYLVLFK